MNDFGFFNHNKNDDVNSEEETVENEPNNNTLGSAQKIGASSIV